MVKNQLTKFLEYNNMKNKKLPKWYLTKREKSERMKKPETRNQKPET
jgi:hypothetical protein